MCGIAGCLGRTTEALETVVRRMSNALVHRGPDDSGVWTDAESAIALGHRRLAIIDLSPEGHQPMRSECGRYVVAFNGEIYNYADIRRELDESGSAPPWRGHSDTEVMLAAIARWGLRAAVERFVGMFAFACWDRTARQLHLVRDRLGEKPLYYGWIDQSFVFGSELKALRAHPQWKDTVDRGALALYMRHSYVPAPFTIYKGISKLLPGSILSVSIPYAGRRPIQELSEYWSLKTVAERSGAEHFSGDESAAVTALDTLLRRTIKRQMVADVPLGAFLSGGIDSSTVVALMQVQSARPVKTFTIGFEESEYNEADSAKAVASHLGTEHTEMYVTAQQAIDVIPRLPALYDEPFADSSQIPTFLVAQLAREHVTVSLSGDGGDELFGGYPRYLSTKSIWDKIGWIPPGVREAVGRRLTALDQSKWDELFRTTRPLIPKKYWRSISGHRVHRLAGTLSARNPKALYRDVMSYWSNPANVVIDGAEPPTTLADGTVEPALAGMIERMMYLDSITYLPDDILVKVDRAAMSVSLETRVPLLDHEVVEFAWRLPAAMKIRDGTGKWLLRQVLNNYVPSRLTDRPKMGFGIPLGPWLRGPLRAWAEDLLSEKRLESEGFFRPGPVRKMWLEHLSGRYDRQYYLWNVLMFQAWHHQYVQRGVQAPAYA